MEEGGGLTRRRGRLSRDVSEHPRPSRAWTGHPSEFGEWPRSRRFCETWDHHETILHAVRQRTLISRISVSLILTSPGSPQR
jgi:hypothetical protein